jgi:hypothetical protein
MIIKNIGLIPKKTLIEKIVKKFNIDKNELKIHISCNRYEETVQIEFNQYIFGEFEYTTITILEEEDILSIAREILREKNIIFDSVELKIEQPVTDGVDYMEAEFKGIIFNILKD